jgi:hypothetical protein
MATDGTLLQGEVTDSATNPLLDGAHVERLLAGFLKALVTEQVTDLRREASVQTPAAGHSVAPVAPSEHTQVISKDPPAEASVARPSLRFIRGGKEGRA